ncbi:Hypothetical predicted protein [Marmota monax]|uniref:C-type lectin domain-containing protein n=1 Tax=Marmota monax TaxID=9995 RepID=A0A5E4CJY4_MARMO|nr:hypothetical protein GHT09_015421 [Marmota monax]VTJ82187.1 Hypothetical predicted protein [Marmota monax]
MASRSMRLLLLLSCVLSPEVLGDILMRPSCATGWFYYRSNCYGYFRKLRNWSDAEKQQWQWIDGASYLYRPWSSRSLGGNKHCTEMGYRNNFVTWNKNECSKRQHFLCKYRP